MSEFSGKKFYFFGDFTFFSDEQRDDALKFHDAILASSLDDGVDCIVEGNSESGSLASKQKTGKKIFREFDFVRDVIFTAQQSDETEDSDIEDYSESISLEIDIKSLVKAVKKIKEDVIYSCVFIYSAGSDETPIIRCLFSYLRAGDQVLFACRGLTDDSSDFPLTQFGLIDVSDNIFVAAFESFESDLANDQLYIAKADGIDGDGFYDADESDESLMLTEGAFAALKKLDAFQNEHYFIDDSDMGYYRLSEDFYKKHKKSLGENDEWIEKGFCSLVYQSAESVLQTGRGWLI